MSTLYAAILTGIFLDGACSSREITEWKSPGQRMDNLLVQAARALGVTEMSHRGMVGRRGVVAGLWKDLKDKSSDQCYHCRQLGHWRDTCPNIHLPAVVDLRMVDAEEPTQDVLTRDPGTWSAATLPSTPLTPKMFGVVSEGAAAKIVQTRWRERRQSKQLAHERAAEMRAARANVAEEKDEFGIRLTNLVSKRVVRRARQEEMEATGRTNKPQMFAGSAAPGHSRDHANELEVRMQRMEATLAEVLETNRMLLTKMDAMATAGDGHGPRAVVAGAMPPRRTLDDDHQ